MKMSKNTLLKKIEQGYRENYCNGEYTLNLVTENKEESTYVLKYTYETGEEIAITITASYLGQVSFYSNIHHYYITNFNNHTKSVINVMRALFDLIDCNKDDMLKWYTVEETADTTLGEESITDTIIADDAIAYQNARVKETKKSVLEVMQCMMCPADREGNRCGGKQWCKQTWKRYDAICNPEWHHVSLATLTNIDNETLDEKSRNYMYLYNLIKDFRKYAFEIIRKDVYFETTSNVFRNIQQLYFNNVISFTTYDYAAKHIQAVGVEKGWFDSKSEETFGYKESRRYKVTLR